VHDEPRTELEQRALAAWTPAEPPPDFVDRVMQAAGRDEPTAHRPDVSLGAPRIVPRFPRVAVAAIVAAALAGTVAAGIKLWPAAPARPAAEVRSSSVEGGAVAPLLPETRADERPNGPVPADMSAQVERYIGTFGRRYGDAFKFQGIVVVARAGQVLYSGSFGRADVDGRAIDQDTRFKVGSLTQQFTAAAVLQLRDAGKLGLDDPVVRHLPDYPYPAVTIRHLLTHTSGIPNYTDGLVNAGVAPGTRYEPQQIAAIFMKAALEFPPGTEFDPSNSGYFLLGMIIERVAGVPLDRYVRDNIFSAAGMIQTSLGSEPALPGEPPVATGFEFSEDELLLPVAKPNDLSVYGGAGGMLTSAADLLRWDRALRRPGLVLSQAALDEMFTAAHETYGLGWIVLRERDQTMVGHPGGIQGFNAAIARYLGDEITVVALANTEAVDCRTVIAGVSAIAHGEAVEPFPEHEEVPVSPAMFSRYTGVFRLTPGSRERLGKMVDRDDLARVEEVRIVDDNGRLFMVVPTHGAKWMHGLGEDRFFFKDQAGTLAQFGPPGAPVENLTLFQGELQFVLARGPTADQNDDTDGTDGTDGAGGTDGGGTGKATQRKLPPGKRP